MKHKVKKSNIVSNVFFRLQTDVVITKKIGILKILYNLSISFCDENLITKKSVALIYHITLIEIANNFKNRLKKTYQKKSHWIKILVIIKLRNSESVNNDSSLKVTDSNSSPNAAESELSSKVIDSTLMTSTLKAISSTLATFSLELASKAVNSRFELRFKYRNSLIYFIAENGRERLYISAALKQKIFQLVYN